MHRCAETLRKIVNLDAFRVQSYANNSVSAIWYWFNQVFVLIVNTDCYTTMPFVTHYWILNYAVIKAFG
jgi:hypothetical protein